MAYQMLDYLNHTTNGHGNYINNCL